MAAQTSRKRKPRALDLYSGCGGLTLGLRRAGFKVVGAVELDPLAVSTYRQNHKSVRVWEQDIRKLTVSDVASALKLQQGELDLLAACPPCQGFSAMRTLNGGKRVIDPSQKDLLFEVLRFARVLRPKSIMLENVPGLERDRRWKRFVGKLERLGYRCNWDVLDAGKYGVPQRRRRLILLGFLGARIEFAPEAQFVKTVRQALRRIGRAGHRRDVLHDWPENRAERIKKLIKAIPRDGGSRTHLGKQLKCHKKCDGFKDVYGRMSWNRVAPTITSGCVNPSKGRFLHPRANRAITLREAAILQTFPRDYIFSTDAGKHAIARMIGNALPPEFIKRQALQIAHQLNAKAIA